MHVIPKIDRFNDTIDSCDSYSSVVQRNQFYKIYCKIRNVSTLLVETNGSTWMHVIILCLQRVGKKYLLSSIYLILEVRFILRIKNIDKIWFPIVVVWITMIKSFFTSWIVYQWVIWKWWLITIDTVHRCI